jgi:hypothetical protein
MIRIFKILSLSIALVAMPAIAFAQNQFVARGTIASISSKAINIDDMAFVLSPTVKVLLPKKKPGAADKNKTGTLEDLKKGDHVLLSIITIDGKRFVDLITITNEDDD